VVSQFDERPLESIPAAFLFAELCFISLRIVGEYGYFNRKDVMSGENLV